MSENNTQKPDKRPRKKLYLLVVICGLIGYISTTLIISQNIIQYSSLPESVTLQVQNAKNGKLESINLPVVHKLPVDTLKDKTLLASGNKITQVAFHENPVFMVWSMLIGIMVAMAAAACVFLVAQFADTCKKFEMEKPAVYGAIAFAVMIIIFLVLVNKMTVGYYRPNDVIDQFRILLEHGYVLDIFVSATVALISPSFASIFLGVVATDRIIGRAHDKTTVAQAAHDLEYLNKNLRAILQILAVIVVFSVLTSSALRESIKSVMHIKGYNIFPTEVCYVYGMYFSLFLFIMYVPAYLYLKYQHGRLKAIAEHIKKHEGIESPAWVEEQLSPVKFDGSVIDQLKLALTVLAPLITGFLPQSLHVFT